MVLLKMSYSFFNMRFFFVSLYFSKTSFQELQVVLVVNMDQYKKNVLSVKKIL